jgi:hypothetical protein
MKNLLGSMYFYLSVRIAHEKDKIITEIEIIFLDLNLLHYYLIILNYFYYH